LHYPELLPQSLRGSALYTAMAQPKFRSDPDHDVSSMPLTSRQTAEYTRQMLDSLQEISRRQNQIVLTRLLQIASNEAARLAEMGR
jgi:hypothetical protein